MPEPGQTTASFHEASHQSAPKVAQKHTITSEQRQERKQQRQVKAAGGAWHPQHQGWRLRQDRVVAPGLAWQIVNKTGSSKEPDACSYR